MKSVDTLKKSAVCCGRIIGCVEDIKTAMDDVAKNGYDFIGCCIAHPRCSSLKGESNKNEELLLPIARPDIVLTSDEWSRLIVAMPSSWIETDSSDSNLGILSRKSLYEEFSYACYLSVPVMLIELQSMDCLNLARIVNSFLNTKTMFGSIWIRVSAAFPESKHDNNCELSIEQNGGDASSITNGMNGTVEHVDDPWLKWNRFRQLCAGSKKLAIALDVPADLPDDAQLERWLGEPVKCLIMDTNIFLTNNQGLPVLSRAHQRFIHAFHKLDVQAMISGPCHHADKGDGAYKRYMNHLFEFWWDHIGEFDERPFEPGYEDELYTQLTPLSDHLSFETYEVFEMDPIKYKLYQDATVLLLSRIVWQSDFDVRVTLMVLGAGRGPIVSACLDAAKSVSCQIKMYAVEKNPGAIVTLNHLKKTKWSDFDVEVIQSDMRDWKPSDLADVVISELLGSFGDNELSPECLDGALHLLKPEIGISIPSSYTSYIAPLQCQKLYNEVLDFALKTNDPAEAFDTGYVVRVHNRYQPCDAQPLFTFNHPNWNKASNDRFAKLSFNIAQDCIIHGMVGYFDSNLYGDVNMSIVPETHSPGMFSWFPIFFPFRKPVSCRGGDIIEFYMWRLSNTSSVWYEWCISSPQVTELQNVNGKFYCMKLQQSSSD